MTILLHSTFPTHRCTNFPAFSHPQATCPQFISRVTSNWAGVSALLDAKARQNTCTSEGLFRAYLILSRCTTLSLLTWGAFRQSPARVHAGTDVKRRLQPASITKLFINTTKIISPPPRATNCLILEISQLIKLIDINQGEKTTVKMECNSAKEYQTSCGKPLTPPSPASPKRHLQIITSVASFATENNMPDQIA